MAHNCGMLLCCELSTINAQPKVQVQNLARQIILKCALLDVCYPYVTNNGKFSKMTTQLATTSCDLA